MDGKTWGSCQVREREYQGLLLVAEYDGNKHLYDMAEVVLLKHLIGEMRITEGMMMGRASSWGQPA